MKKFIFFLLLSILVVSGCQSEEAQQSDDLPYRYIQEEFSYSPFAYPDHWDVVSVQSEVSLQYKDDEAPENHAYSDVPYRYTIEFGKEASKNNVTEKEMERYNEQQALKGETNRQHYYHTYNENYATVDMSKNGFVRLISQVEEAEEWEISGEDFLVLRNDNEWIVNWYKDGTYYDIFIRKDAEITTAEACRELLELMFF
ncbi:hypothetical protein SAMN05421736_106158 [Evansella caseinilytica]|uniref:DUF4367 domain-containing protein n=1 Tax=Evansella caseinilytica TaxID=1503961 RepID=A0A1H3QFS7_9BACI|nr:membrane lipoprotein lipid attachment site-containing protein [Evansella caseinilytica]SDZ12246.1 hypothetical protein SAMN05421736_106158 [Evansella caseinilytica]